MNGTVKRWTICSSSFVVYSKRYICHFTKWKSLHYSASTYLLWFCLFPWHALCRAIFRSKWYVYRTISTTACFDRAYCFREQILYRDRIDIDTRVHAPISVFGFAFVHICVYDWQVTKVIKSNVFKRKCETYIPYSIHGRSFRI